MDNLCSLGLGQATSRQAVENPTTNAGPRDRGTFEEEWGHSKREAYELARRGCRKRSNRFSRAKLGPSRGGDGATDRAMRQTSWFNQVRMPCCKCSPQTLDNPTTRCTGPLAPRAIRPSCNARLVETNAIW